LVRCLGVPVRFIAISPPSHRAKQRRSRPVVVGEGAGTAVAKAAPGCGIDQGRWLDVSRARELFVDGGQVVQLTAGAKKVLGYRGSASRKRSSLKSRLPSSVLEVRGIMLPLVAGRALEIAATPDVVAVGEKGPGAQRDVGPSEVRSWSPAAHDRPTPIRAGGMGPATHLGQIDYPVWR